MSEKFSALLWENELYDLFPNLTDKEFGFLIYALELADDFGIVQVGNIRFEFPELRSFIDSINNLRRTEQLES